MTQILFKKGTIIDDRYDILGFVAEGGMQQVFKALDQRLNREVALKTPINESGRKRFKDSAVLSARVTHPNVAKTLDLFEASGRQFLIEEFIEGTNLKERYEQTFFFMDPYLVCFFLHRIAKGIAASHHVKVFHRDLKPSNIMVSAEPLPIEIKVTDFGIAKMAGEEIEKLSTALDDSDKTLAVIETSKTIKGAFPYMAPELLQNEDPSLPADIWSLGAIGYELLCGKKPYGEGLRAISAVVSGKKPPAPEFQNTNAQFRAINEALWSLLQRCFEFEPAKRITADQAVTEFGQLCYSYSSRKLGRISMYGRGPNPKTGVIIGDHGEEAFFHKDSFYGGNPAEGQRVLYTAFPGEPNERAHPALLVKASN